MDPTRLSEIVLNYTAYLVTGLLLLALFFVVYTRITPHEERHHVRNGNTAVALPAQELLALMKQYGRM